MPLQLESYDFVNPSFLDLGTLELNKIWMIQSGLDFEGSIYEYSEQVKQAEWIRNKPSYPELIGQ